MSSILVKPPYSLKNINSGSGATNIASGQIKIDLNKDLLVEEHMLNIGVSQTFGTNAPTSSDVRRFFSRIELVSSAGVQVSADFHQLYDMARFTEKASNPVIVLGAGGGAAATAQFSVDLHHIMDESIYDLWTALRTPDLSSLSVVLTIAPDASNGFIGGTGTIGVAAYTVTVDQKALPGLSGKTENDRELLKYGAATHKFISLGEITGGAAITNQKFKLKAGNRTRFLFFHTHSVTGGALANGILDTLTFTVPGHEYLQNIKAESIQAKNDKSRGFYQDGVYVADFGDDPRQWPDLRGVNEISVDVVTKATAPASWRMTCAQDFAEGLERFGV